MSQPFLFLRAILKYLFAKPTQRKTKLLPSRVVTRVAAADRSVGDKRRDIVQQLRTDKD
jgi:hypothetical protein